MWLDSLLQWTQHGDALINYSVPLHRRYLPQPEEPATWKNRQAHNLVWYFPLHPHGPVWPIKKTLSCYREHQCSNLHPGWQRHAYKASSLHVDVVWIEYLAEGLPSITPCCQNQTAASMYPSAERVRRVSRWQTAHSPWHFIGWCIHVFLVK